MTKPLRIGILGATGSVGTQALDVIRKNKDCYTVGILTAGHNDARLEKQAAEFLPGKAVSFSGKAKLPQGVKGHALSEHVLNDPAFYAECDLVLNALPGMDGLLPAAAVLKSRARLATANKESLVAAGKFLTALAKEGGKEIIPVDSEHSAVWQCLQGETAPVHIVLTASGGAFRSFSKEQLKNATAADALKHPTWQMGKKVTVDSATLMNKSMELLEARWLFGTENVDVLMHAESRAHAFVTFADGSTKCALSRPDMQLPIQYAFSHPARGECLAPLTVAELAGMTFSLPDKERFPCLKIGESVLKTPRLGVVMAAADEVCVEAYLQNKIGFYDIPRLIEAALCRFEGVNPGSINEVLCIDAEVKEYTLSRMQNSGGTNL